MEPLVHGRCGERIDSQDRSANTGRLTMTGSFPAQVAAGGETSFSGTVTITNRSDEQVSGTAPSGPDIYVTRAGEIVAVPVIRDDIGVLVDLAPGALQEFEATGSLRPCAAEPPGQERLVAGRYEIYALLDIPDGTSATVVSAVGGPWAFEVR